MAALDSQHLQEQFTALLEDAGFNELSFDQCQVITTLRDHLHKFHPDNEDILKSELENALKCLTNDFMLTEEEAEDLQLHLDDIFQEAFEI